MIRFANPLVLVSDVARAAAFYRDVIGLAVVEEHDNFVLFTSGFAIHHGNELLDATYGGDHRQDSWGRDNLVLYFETDTLDSTHDRIRGLVPLIHPLRTEPWGQRVLRLHDPDRHIIEIGEPQATD